MDGSREAETLAAACAARQPDRAIGAGTPNQKSNIQGRTFGDTHVGSIACKRQNTDAFR